MNRTTKRLLGSTALALLLLGGSEAFAGHHGGCGCGGGFHHGHGHGHGHGRGGGCGVGGGVDWGIGYDGMYICLDGSTPMLSGTFSASIGDPDTNCDNSQYDFTSVVTGGFVSGSAHADSPNMIPGQNDETQDGFWYREGPFSSPVAYGDVNNDGKRYDPNSDEYPAWTWGHPEADPFVSPGGPGDNLGGAAGIGSAGFTVGINADDESVFYPFHFLQANNNVNSVIGTYSTDLAWNVKIYDKYGEEVYSHTFTNTLYYWETLNYQTSKYDIICPRMSVEAGESVNDLAYSKDIQENKWSVWPVYGLGIDFISDGGTDTKACSDPITLKNKEMSDTFRVGFQKYKVTLEGPYVYDEKVDGCPALDEKGLPDTTDAWQAKCFKKVDTIWVNEDIQKSAFMRVKVEKESRFPF